MFSSIGKYRRGVNLLVFSLRRKKKGETVQGCDLGKKRGKEYVNKRRGRHYVGNWQLRSFITILS